MGLQEGLILLGVAVFLLILIDALRRKRAASLQQQDDDDLDPEEQAKREQLERELPGFAEADRAHSKGDLDPLFDEIEVFDDDPIPVLRTPVNLDTEEESDPVKVNPEASPLSVDEVRQLFQRDPDFDAEAKRAAIELQKELDELDQTEAFESLSEEAPVDPSEIDQLDTDWPDEPEAAEAIEQESEPEPEPVAASSTAEPIQQQSPVEPPQQDDSDTTRLVNLEQLSWGQAEEFLTININAPSDQPFEGAKLSYLMDMIGMKLSASGFFHYIEKHQGQSQLGYSMVNMFSPGSFDPQALEDFTTQGVVLVMALPSTPKPQAIFERMLETARVFERNWGAELQDEQRSNLTLQTIEHYRQRIQDFERKTRLQAIKARQGN